jgi:hypothetical protein
VLTTPTNPSGVFDTIVYFAIFFIPLLLIVYSYTRIFIAARKSLSSGNRPGDGAAQAEMKRKRRFLRELKLAKSCFLVTCTFGLSFVPFMVLSLMLNFLDQETITMLFSWAMAVAALNSSLNSFIFFWSKAMLRKEAIKVLKICCS